jgi:GNAT superfamily N-acetyltransferase
MLLIRKRDDGDVPGCVSVVRSVHLTDGYPAIWPSDPARWLTCGHSDTDAWVATNDLELVRGHFAVLVGEEDEVFQSYIKCRPQELLSLVRLFVDPAFLGRGAGVALLCATLQYARGHGPQPVLEVAADGGATIHLYERLGWSRRGERQADWTNPACPGSTSTGRRCSGPSDFADAADQVTSLGFRPNLYWGLVHFTSGPGKAAVQQASMATTP